MSQTVEIIVEPNTTEVNVSEGVAWDNINNKPAVIAAGDTIQEALEQIGLENVNAEINSLQATKVDKVAGLGLSQENFTTSLKNKLDSITAIFTTTLKTAYDSAVTWISTNGANILNHLSSTSNPHSVTKTQVGLGSVDNTPDTAKPLSVLAVASYNAASGINTPLTNAMSPIQMFQNLQKQNDNKAPISGSANYIQSQFAAAQSANLWISGTVRCSFLQSLAGSSGNAIFSAFQSGVRDWTFGQRANQTFVFNNGGGFAGTDILTISPSGDVTVTGKMIAGTAPTNATDVVRLSDMSVVNTTTTALSSATLNSTYPNVIIGFRVICHLITGAPTIYTKATENGSSDIWLSTSATVTP